MKLVVKQNVVGGWDVIAPPAVEPLHRSSSRSGAEAFARKKCRSYKDGYTVVGLRGQILGHVAPRSRAVATGSSQPFLAAVSQPTSPAETLRESKPNPARPQLAGHPAKTTTPSQAQGRQAARKSKANADPPDIKGAVEVSGNVLQHNVGSSSHAQTPQSNANSSSPSDDQVKDVVSAADLALGELARRGSPVAAQVKREGQVVNRWLKFALPVVSALFTSAIAPSVTKYGVSYLGVFFATLGLSLGCAIGIAIVRNLKLTGYAANFAYFVAFIIASGISTQLGIGVLKPVAVTSPCSGPFCWAQPILLSAEQTYGVIGMLLSIGIGSWLGWRASEAAGDSGR